ncbi:TRAP transporter substrate-binding protein DctP [Castellaniella sp.]|uniref:TRAP transporter substrate-binding protein DctP n=1 Tax=Castellaniella sp. TaxID=1955812 RepID=UPI00355CB746
MLKPFAMAASAAAILGLAAPAQATDLTIAASLPEVHFWVGNYLNPFADAMEKESDIEFQRFYAGALTSVGRELDALQGGTIDVAVPLLAPYHEGRFALSDVTQLPTYDTTSVMTTKAFQNLLDSDAKLKDGKTFYEYEIADKNIHAWPLGATGAYAISTTGKALKSPEDLQGMPLRAGSALHTIVLTELGATPVTMPSAQAYEALSRGTIDGMVSSIGDWKSYSFQELLKYTITGVSLGHWESYLATTDEVWNNLSDEERATWDKVARQTALDNAAGIDRQDEEVKAAAEADGSQFVAIDDLSEAMQNHIARAAADTWIKWVEQTDEKGHPGKATARLWMDLITQQGGKVPVGVAEYLAN